ncbi:MAG TPA: glycosyltransferase family 9 protein [Candidatus Margulisiibacteriota bacterium]|nr:glycosyltransferase family 9 protein [Candidatus Margulisiibacteriota bacterium]
MKKFLIINPFGIGDVLFTKPVIMALKDSFPGCKVGYWCNERVSLILKNNPYIDKIFALSRGDLKKISKESKIDAIKKSWKLLREMRRERYDIALDFSLDHRYSLLAKLLGIKERFGFDYKGRGIFSTRKIYLEGYSSKHIVEYYLDLLKFLHIEPKTREMDLFVPESNRAKMRHMLTRYGLKEEDCCVGIFPGAGESWGKNASLKHWSALKFAQLADRLTESFSAKVILMGTDSEIPMADIIVAAAKNKIVNLVGKTSIDETAALMSLLDLVITNDGGPLHMAVALKLKTVSIFGPVDDLVYGPYPPSGDHIVIKRQLDCRPCYMNFRFKGCAFNHACIDGITVEEVFQGARRLIKNEG